MIRLILDTMIPADLDRGMPSAASINFEAYVSRFAIESEVDRLSTLIQNEAQKRFEKSFEDIPTDQRLQCINACKTVDIRLFMLCVQHIFRAYYTDKSVHKKLSVGSSPPFPNGNSLPQDDWSILETVYERGLIYRKV